MKLDEVVAAAEEWLAAHPDPTNLCGEAAQYLKRRFPEVEWGYGWYMDQPHNWVTVDGVIVDPTVCQFGGPREVFVGRDDWLYWQATPEEVAPL